MFLTFCDSWLNIPIACDDALRRSHGWTSSRPRHLSRPARVRSNLILRVAWESHLRMRFTHLVIDLLGSIWQGDLLLEDVANLLKLLALRPIVESTRHVDIAGWMRPMGRHVSANTWRLVIWHAA